ncbi:MAG: hypothetical protein KJ674_00975 [Nanoarchaeota archaeon]|nr:hypothetical protein [Nanoarchaeota archaeon]
MKKTLVAIATLTILGALAQHNYGHWRLNLLERNLSVEYAIDFAKKTLENTNSQVEKIVLYGYREAFQEYLQK